MDEGNEVKDLATEQKQQAIQEEKVFTQVVLTSKNGNMLNTALIVERQVQDEKSGNKGVVYDVYMEFNKEPVLIASIDENGNVTPNENFDAKYSTNDIEKIKEMQRLLGDKINIDELQKQVEQAKSKTREEDERKKENLEKQEDEEENEKEVGQLEREGEQKVLAKKIGTNPQNVCKIRRDSQFFKNYPNIPRTAFFYLDSNDKMHAKFIDKEGNIQELQGFSETKDRREVTRLGRDGSNIKEEIPYRVMTAEGLEDKNQNTQSVRIAMYKDELGELKVETIHQGRNGEWEGKNLDLTGKERNTAQMNKIIDEKHKAPLTGKIAKRREELEKSGFSQDGISLDELSKGKKIEEYMQEGYTKEEGEEIYNYVVGEEQLTEPDAKEKVATESQKKAQRPEHDGEGRVPWPTE